MIATNQKSFKSFRNRDKENVNKSPNIGELQSSKRKSLVRKHHEREEEELRERGLSERSGSGSHSDGSGVGVGVGVGVGGSQSQSQKLKLQLQKQKQKQKQNSVKQQHPGPLNCLRDPLRKPLQNRLPFTTDAQQGQKICYADSETSISISSGISSGIHTGRNGRGHGRTRDFGNGSASATESASASASESGIRDNRKRQKQRSLFPSEQYRISTLEGSQKDRILPAYAYKGAKSKLLEISSKPPQLHDVDIDIEMGERDHDFDVHNVQSGNAIPITYPIALNAGAVGVHTGADFGEDGFNAMSHNTHRSNWTAVNPVLTFPWNLGEGTFSEEKKKFNQARTEERQSKIGGVLQQPGLEVMTGSGSEQERNNNNSDETVEVNPWKEWEKHNRHMAPIFEFGGGRPLPRLPKSHKTKSTRKSGIYNEDDFDYALLLRPMEEYEECAMTLDIASELSESIFDRANSGNQTPRPSGGKSKRTSSVKSPFKVRKKRNSTGKFTPYRRSPVKPTPPSSRGRRWARNELRSAPVKSVRKRSPKRSTFHRQSKSAQKDKKNRKYKDSTGGNGNPNILDLDSIPNPKVPRGMAKKHGLEEFLWALEQGFVVRRHRPGHDPVFLKLYSKNRGDTIHYEYVDPDDAVTALRSQIQRYGTNSVRGVNDKIVKQKISAWAPGCKERHDSGCDHLFDEDGDNAKSDNLGKSFLEQYNTSLPENESRRSSLGGIIDSLTAYTSKAVSKAFYSGSFKASEMVEVQRATHDDPLSQVDDEYGDEESLKMLKGSHTIRECMDFLKAKWLRDFEKYDLENNEALRKSKSDVMIRNYPVTTRTFTLILPTIIQRFSSIKEANILWSTGETSPKNFSFVDLETATNGEYWMLFRGFLLLQRDAYNGRFARDRASGFGCSYRSPESKDGAKKNVLFTEEKQERKEAKVKIKVKNMRTKENETEIIKKIPPPDFYLGETPGTQIWGRLRLAGLETERMFDLETRNVMIKIKCPRDRLMDVAEVLELELRTKDGDYATFQESRKSIFANDGDFGRLSQSIFSSSIRQHIISYILNSQIRDTGAGLSVKYSLAKKGIRARSPLHMHESLESLFRIWYNFTDESHWKIIMKENDLDQSGNYLVQNNHSINDGSDELPHRMNRLIVGLFYLPLDSIERYYGEKVAFYFAWLQHCSTKLIFPSILGVIVTLIQAWTQQWEDNKVLPIFSFIIMVWSFHVMISWKKIQNDLTHRWGTMKYQENETPRPQFYGKHKICEITKRSIVTYPSWKRWMKYMISIPLTMMFTGYAFLGVIMVYTNRDNVLANYFGDPDQDVGELFDLTWNLSIIGKTDAIVAVDLSSEHLTNPKFWFTVGLLPSLIGLSLPLLNFLLMRVSRVLNDFENHRTESHYRNALIAKVIAFRFVAYFAALYYYASVAATGSVNGLGDAAVKNGFLRIATSLVIYLTIQHWWSLFLQICVPLLVLTYRKDRRNNILKTERRDLENMKKEYRENHNLTDSEVKTLHDKIRNKEALLRQGTSDLWEEMMLPDYDPFFDYIQSIIYFAYVVCFSSVFPITPIFVLINQLINMRLHAYKICRVRRRPLAQKTGGLANWEQVLNTVTMIGVLTNTSLMVLTNSLFDFLTETYKENQGVALLGAFVVWERVMITIKYMMQFVIPDKSNKLTRILKKEEHAKNEKSRNLREIAKNKRQSSVSTTIYKAKSNVDEKSTVHSLTPSSMSDQFSSPPDLSQGENECSPLVDRQRNSDRAINSEKSASKKWKKKTQSRRNTPQPNTPKAHGYANKKGSVRGNVKANANTNSPFNQFIPDDTKSPLLAKEDDSVDDSQAISDFLSLNSSHSKDSFGGEHEYRTPSKNPSMQRSMQTRYRESELHAAGERIRNRLYVPKSERKTRK